MNNNCTNAAHNSAMTCVSEHWYAVCCKPRQESIAEENLQRQGYCTYLPRICSSRRRRGQWVDVIEPLFPRYLFIRIDPALRSTAPVRSTRGAIGLVRFGGQPAVVPEQMIEAIRQRADANSGLHQSDHPLFCTGDAIRLAEGPLAGMDGVFVEESSEKRVIVLLELLGKSNKIRVNRNWIIPVA